MLPDYISDTITDLGAGIATGVVLHTVGGNVSQSESVQIAMIIQGTIVTLVHAIFAYLIYKERKKTK